MRNILVVLISLLAATSYARAESRAGKFEFSPPVGWTRNDAAAGPIAKQFPGVLVSDVVVYQGANREMLTVVYSGSDAQVATPRAGISEFNRGVVKGLVESGAILNGEATLVESDRSITLTQHVHVQTNALTMKVISTIDKQHMLRAVVGMCVFASTECETALASLTNTTPSAERVGLDDKLRDKNSAYRMGQLVGRILAVLAVVVLVVWLIRRKSKQA
jgi:hypothetical protein